VSGVSTAGPKTAGQIEKKTMPNRLSLI